MRIRSVILSIFFLSVWLISVYANGVLEISGIKIPLVQGATTVVTPPMAAVDARVATYRVDTPLAQVIEFYQGFLAQNDFLVIGGPEPGGYSASVKKGDVLFSIKIYPSDQQTIIQFIW